VVEDGLCHGHARERCFEADYVVTNFHFIGAVNVETDFSSIFSVKSIIQL
jgi:hypothetical protein